MWRRTQTLIVLLLIALVPLRAMAFGAIGVHAAHDESVATHAHDGSGHEAAQHHGDEAPGDASHGCSHGAGHCTGASIIAPTDSHPLPVIANAAPIVSGGQRALGFLPDLLDRPPLAS